MEALTPADRLAELRAAAASGLMALTGQPDGPPLGPPAGLVSGLRTLTAAVGQRTAEAGTPLDLRWEPIVTGRAALLGLSRRGRCSAGGTCRLLRAREGWVAVNLARPDDVRAVDAIVGGVTTGEPWTALADAAAAMTAELFVDRVRLLGVPAATLAARDQVAPGDHRRTRWDARRLWPPLGARPPAGLRVVDLSSMWAGPLAASILADAGAEVTKVESAARRDGARALPLFYRALHPDRQPEVQLDFTSDAGRAALRRAVEDADVVIESSRPRALEQLGAGPFDVAARPGRIWVSISGYGRGTPGRDWVAFGDDAAVGGGLVSWEAPDLPVFCGDALADPVTGLTAAVATLEALAHGGGVLLDLSMARCCRALLDPTTCAPGPSARAERAPGGGWQLTLAGEVVPVLDAHRPVTGEPNLGSHTRQSDASPSHEAATHRRRHA